MIEWSNSLAKPLTSCTDSMSDEANRRREKLARILFERCTVRDWHAAHVEDDLPADNPREPIGSEMMRALLRYHNEMGVRHAIPVDQIADALQRESVTHASAQVLCD